MKNVLLIFFFIIGGLGLISAQHETLFRNSRVVGGFGAAINEIGFNKDVHSAAGGGGGVIIENVFLGAYGMASADFKGLFDTGNLDQLDLGHGGLWLGYTFKPYQVLHLYSSARIGWGAINIKTTGSPSAYRDLDKVFVMTPEIGLELNVFRWFRIAGTAGYRIVNGVNEESGFKNEDFGGGIASVAFRFGWFGWRRG